MPLKTAVKQFLSNDSNRVALMLVIGFMLIMAHYANQPLIKYIFLPQIGMALLLATVLMILYNKRHELTLGPKWLWIPLAVISGSAVLRAIIYHDINNLAGALFMSSMFGLYVVCRIYGEKTLSFFYPLAIIGTITIIVQSLINTQGENPGIFSEYATSSQFLVFSWLVAPRKHQWWLSGVVIAGLLFSGAEEALFYIAAGGIFILARRDWSKKIWLPVGVLVAFAIFATLTGFTQIVFERAYITFQDVKSVLLDHSLTQEEKDAKLQEATNGRWLEGWRLHRPIVPLGYGVNLTYHYRGIPHNIVLLIIDQLGPLAMLAWLFAVIAGIRKTTWKYAYFALILFGMFQPFVWTKMAPWMWAVAGASSSERSSYIFRE